MNNGCQKYNGCGADKEGWKIFNTFFYPELQSENVSKALRITFCRYPKEGITKH